jgi:cytochrome c oxidase subunit 2
MTQQAAWMLSLCLMAAVASAFILVSARASAYGGAAAGYRGRTLFVLVLLCAGVAIASITLGAQPAIARIGSDRSSAPVMTVKATGHQWKWELSESDVPLGKPVLFEVTADDVNHGLGIYRGRTELIGQVQAMPGYINRIIVTFDERGEYHLLCMEYCGVAHHGMESIITVR